MKLSSASVFKLLTAAVAASVLVACATTAKNSAPDQSPTPANTEAATSSSSSSPSTNAVPTATPNQQIEPAFTISRGPDVPLTRFALMGVAEQLIAALAPKQGKIFLFNAASGQLKGEMHEDVALKNAEDIITSGFTVLAVSPKEQNMMLWRYEYNPEPIGLLKYTGPSAPVVTQNVFAPNNIQRVLQIDDSSGKRELVFVDIQVMPPRLNRHMVLDDLKYSTTKRMVLADAKVGDTANIYVTKINDQTQVVISSGSTIRAFDVDGKPLNTGFPKVDRPIFGMQVRRCASGFGSLMLIGSTQNGDARIDLFDPDTNNKLGSFSVNGLKNPSQMKFFERPMEFFPSGAIYFISDNKNIVGVDWATIAKATGVRERCF
jgi:hypothetical protein